MKKNYDVVVLGGSAAGIAAAITAKRHYPKKSVLVIRDQQKVQIPCGIPYIFGTVDGPDKNLIPDAVLEKNGIEFHVGSVKTIGRKEKNLKLENGENCAYEKLVLATGSLPLEPPIEGMGLKNVFTVKKEGNYLASVLEKVNTAKDIVIIGGGFIGVEFAEECAKNRKLNLTIVELLSNCLGAVFEKSACEVAEEVLKKQGVNIMVGEKVTAFEGVDAVEAVKLKSGKKIKTDLVILGIGAKPNSFLAKECGLEIEEGTGAIKVDNRQRSSGADIFACGDCATKRSFYDRKPSRLMLASIASTEARIAGANLFKLTRENPGVVGAFSTVLGGVAFAVAGLTEKAAGEHGFETVSGVAKAPNRHPGDMPGMAELEVRLVFNRENMVLIGCQVTGAFSGGEQINVAAACIQSKMTADGIAAFQMATHPALTASPIVYQLVNAAEMALKIRRQANEE